MEVFAKRMRFDGFNLVVGDASRGTAHYVGNRGSANAETPMELRMLVGCMDWRTMCWTRRGQRLCAARRSSRRFCERFRGYSADALPTRALEEQVLRDVLHAPLDARPLAMDAAERLSYSSSDGDAPAPSAAARELWRHQQSFVAGGRRRDSHRGLRRRRRRLHRRRRRRRRRRGRRVRRRANRGVRKRALLRPSRRAPRPSQLRHSHVSSRPRLRRRSLFLVRAPLRPGSPRPPPRAPPRRRRARVRRRPRRFPRRRSRARVARLRHSRRRPSPAHPHRVTPRVILL